MLLTAHARYAMHLLLLVFIIGLGCVSLRAPSSKSDPNKNQDPQATDPSDIAIITAVPNRPTFSTTAESVQSGVFEIEYGFEAGDGHQNINGLLKFGLTKNLELRFANNLLERDAGVAGLGDSGAGFKYKLFQQEDWRPTFSVLYS